MTNQSPIQPTRRAFDDIFPARREESTAEWQRIYRYLRPYRRRLVLALLAKLAASGMFLLVPAVMEDIVDTVLADRDASRIDEVVGAMVAVFFVLSAISIVGNYMMQYIGERVMVDIRQELYAHLQSLSLRFFAERRVGELISRISSDVTIMRTVLTDDLIALTRQVLTAVGGLSLMLLLNWRLTLVALVTVPVVMVLGVAVTSFTRRGGKEVQDEVAGATIVAQEVLHNIREVKSFVREEYEIRRYNRAVEQAFSAALRLVRIRATVGPIVDFLFAFSVAVILWFGGREVIAGRMSGGELVAFLMYAGIIGQTFAALSLIYTRLQETIGATQRIFEILDTGSDLTDAPDAIALPPVEGRITFDAVDFAYESGHKVLSDINLDIAPGEIVALVGPSGAGKSTMFNLIPRFYDVTRGTLAIDGHDVHHVTRDSLRQQVGIVPQETLLFGGTIRENILYGRLDASEADMIAAARAANAHDFISALPRGYDTVVGERGVRLSGGQRQRVAIARAILKDPRILLLDEATSALDNESEQLVQEALERLMQDRTTVIVAHRLSTIRVAHRIAVLDEGRIVELGSHEELMAQNGLYARLYEMQFQGETALAVREPTDWRALGSAAQTAPRALSRYTPTAILPTVEREYAPFWAVLWRRRQGWRASWYPGTVAEMTRTEPWLTALRGLFYLRFTRKPRRLVDTTRIDLVGARVEAVQPDLARNGRSGIGLFGLRLRLADRSLLTLAVALKSAERWITVNGKLSASSVSGEQRERLAAEGFRFFDVAHLVGCRVVEADFSDAQFTLVLAEPDTSASPTDSVELAADAATYYALELRHDGHHLPALAGNGTAGREKRRSLGADEQLPDAVIISRGGDLAVR